MRFLVFISLVVLCSACAKEHGKPIASLIYLDVAAKPAEGLYDLRFKSDVDLLRLFSVDESPAGAMFYCALGDDADFSVDHVLEKSGYGTVRYDEQVRGEDGYVFVVTLFFKETFNGGRSTRTLGDDELHELLMTKQMVPCSYVATSYDFKPYYSGVLKVPARDILRGLNR
jgi:hypothetical protein